MNTTEEKEKAREDIILILEKHINFLDDAIPSIELSDVRDDILDYFQEWQKSQGETFSRQEVEELLNVLSQVTRSLSRICNNPNAICGVDFSRLERAKLALSKFSNLDVNQIPQPQNKKS